MQIEIVCGGCLCIINVCMISEQLIWWEYGFVVMFDDIMDLVLVQCNFVWVDVVC